MYCSAEMVYAECMSAYQKSATANGHGHVVSLVYAIYYYNRMAPLCGHIPGFLARVDQVRLQLERIDTAMLRGAGIGDGPGRVGNGGMGIGIGTMEGAEDGREREMSAGNGNANQASIHVEFISNSRGCSLLGCSLSVLLLCFSFSFSFTRVFSSFFFCT